MKILRIFKLFSAELKKPRAKAKGFEVDKAIKIKSTSKRIIFEIDVLI